MTEAERALPQDRLTDNIRLFAADVAAQNPVHKKFMDNALVRISGDEIRHLDAYIGFCLRKGLDIPYLAECYLTIVSDTLREQVYFQKNGRYRHARFDEVASDVYFNPDYMRHYMYGLALTSFLWPNHLAMFSFFRKTLPVAEHGRYLEIGSGHGYYLMTAALHSAYDSFLGVDISETSVAMTRELVAHYMKDRAAKPLEVQCLDFLAADLPEKSFDAVVMGEVLEHVERPELFLRRIRDIAKDGAYIYVTTCINAPAVDHIYLFETVKQLEEMFAASGLAVREKLICPYEGKTLEQSVAQRLAINVACVLGKV